MKTFEICFLNLMVFLIIWICNENMKKWYVSVAEKVNEPDNNLDLPKSIKAHEAKNLDEGSGDVRQLVPNMGMKPLRASRPVLAHQNENSQSQPGFPFAFPCRQ